MSLLDKVVARDRRHLSKRLRLTWVPGGGDQMLVYPGAPGGQGRVFSLSVPTREGPDGQATSQLSVLPTARAAGLCRDPTGLA